MLHVTAIALGCHEGRGSALYESIKRVSQIVKVLEVTFRERGMRSAAAIWVAAIVESTAV
jgi:hypothetical protein